VQITDYNECILCSKIFWTFVISYFGILLDAVILSTGIDMQQFFSISSVAMMQFEKQRFPVDSL
jgi:hypothetical protein